MGAGWGTYALHFFRTAGVQAGDFSQIWLAARALLEGREPYAAVLEWERAGHFAHDLGFYYPYPAAFVGLPFAGLRAELAAPAFVALSYMLGAYAATRESWWRLGAFLGPSAYMNLRLAQWGGLLTAAMVLPAVWGWLVALKPTTGLAAWAWRPSWRGLVAGATLVVVSLVMDPTWPIHWLATVRDSPYARVVLVQSWYAPVVLLAALRWRTSEGRLLLCMACVPHTPFWYDEMLLGAVPRTPREAFWTVLPAWVAFLCYLAADVRADPHGPLNLWAGVPWLILGVYLPTLVIVLRRRNEGRIPAGLERWLRRVPLPEWIGGSSAVETKS